MKIEIQAVGPAYRGAPYPKFDPLGINERTFEDELRCKACRAEYDAEAKRGKVKWVAQDSDAFSRLLEAEIVRAFKANGAKFGEFIDVEFGMRGRPLDEITLMVD